jgi:hypothetical protein
MKSKLRELLDAMPLPPGEPFPGETLIADGWVYRDIPGIMLPEYWDMLLSAIGEGHYRILAMSRINRDGKEWCRGQLLISPTGMENLRNRKK